MAKSQASEFILGGSVFNELLPQKSMLNATVEELLNTFEFKSASMYVNNVPVDTAGLEDGTGTQEASSTRVRYQAPNSRPLVIPIRAFFNISVAADDTFDYKGATEEQENALVPMYQHINEELITDKGAALPKMIKVISVRNQTIKDDAGKEMDVYPISNYKMFQDEVTKLEKAESATATEEGRDEKPVDVRDIFRNRALLRKIQLTGAKGLDLDRFPKPETVKDIAAIVL